MKGIDECNSPSWTKLRAPTGRLLGSAEYHHEGGGKFYMAALTDCGREPAAGIAGPISTRHHLHHDKPNTPGASNDTLPLAMAIFLASASSRRKTRSTMTFARS